MLRSGIWFILCAVLAGCATPPPAGPASRQQAQADLVVNFQSWNCISFIKPDISGVAGALPVRKKTFRRAAFEKLVNGLKGPRDFVVVVLDRGYEPDAAVANRGMDAIQKVFGGLGFRRIAFQDGAAARAGDLPILRDTIIKQPE